MSKLPKIIKLEQRGICRGIIRKTDELLSQGLSYRGISKQLMKIYQVSVSYQSVRRYALYKQDLVKQQENTRSRSETIYTCVRPIRQRKYTLLGL